MKMTQGIREKQGRAAQAPAASGGAAGAPRSPAEMAAETIQQRVPILEVPPNRMMRSPLDCSILDCSMRADLYLVNGFRLLSQSANASDDALEPHLQRFRQLAKLSEKRALKKAAALGYDKHVPIRDAADSVARLNDSRRRIVDELFWPHVARLSGNWPAPAQLAGFAEKAFQAGGRYACLARHAMAIAHHNLAIAHEIEFAYGRAEWTDRHWIRALELWSAVWKDDAFWSYVGQRVAALDDPLLTDADVAKIRATLPGAIMGFNVLFAREYAVASAHEVVVRHVRLLSESGFADEDRKKAVVRAVEEFTRRRINPVGYRLEDEILNQSGTSDRKDFAARYEPIVTEAEGVVRYLRDELGLDLDTLDLRCFDDLVKNLLKAVNQKVNYKTDDSMRAALYSAIQATRLLELPVSSGTIHMIQESLRTDRKLLWRDFVRDGKPDPTQCFFAEGQPADPDSSLIVRIHKVTSRKVKVDHARGTAGVSVGYNQFQLIVPRSMGVQPDIPLHAHLPCSAVQ